MPDLRVPYDARVTVDHDSPEPLYRQVAALLRGRITSGEFTGRLPSLKTIAQEYGVSHITAEKAMDLLKEDGLVVVVVGRGAYVKKDLGTIRLPGLEPGLHGSPGATLAGADSVGPWCCLLLAGSLTGYSWLVRALIGDTPRTSPHVA